MDMNQYIEIFIEESKENLQRMNEILLELENDQDDLNYVNEIFRIAHTLKGMSGTMGYSKVADLTHNMENVLDALRNNEMKMTNEIVDILFECFDALEAYIDQLEKNGQEGDLDSSQIIFKLENLKDGDSQEHDKVEEVKKVDEIQEANQRENTDNLMPFSIDVNDLKDLFIAGQEQNVYPRLIRITLSDDCMLKTARAFIVFNTLEKFGEILRSYPIAEDIEDEKFDNYFEVLFLTKLDEISIKNELQHISEVEKIEVTTCNIEDISDATVEVIHDDVIDEAIQEKAVSASEDQKEKATEVKPTRPKTNDKNRTVKTVRVEIGRLDNLMNLVSELIIVKTRLEDLDSSAEKQDMNEAIEYLERITTSLNDAVMKVRMVPVERTFNRFPRLVRDLSKDLGKNIKLIMTGEDTEVDRTVIDEIGDPLIHLIRNSLDHGIESPEERVRKGKSETGTVNLRAYPDGNTVVIEVEDDGQGINPDIILNKAIQKKIITKEASKTMSDKEIINLLFAPGFSTAEVITDVSGRGVGLDVVKSKIESINGTVEVVSSVGQGSKFIIRLPLTLAIIQALMVNLESEKYAIPLNNIKEITTIKSKDLTLVQDQEVVLYRNNTLPIIRLKDVLNVNHSETELPEDLIIVIVKKGTTEAGLVVDDLIGQQEIVIKSLGKYLKGIKAIAGATILGNGSVALIVDSNQLF